MINLVIADDHKMFIDGIHSLLKTSRHIHVIGEAGTGIALLELLKNTSVDVVLMDVSMPEMNGVDATKEVKRLFPGIRIIALTMHDTPDYIARLLKAGVDGYILKNTGQKELLSAIETVANGETYFSTEVTGRIMEGLQGKKPKSDPLIVDLTDREKDVLKLIVQELTTQQIAAQLFISTHTVETHRKNLISKLGVKNIAGLVKYALQHGLAE